MAESDDRNARDANTAARATPDVGQQHIGELYARALLGATAEAGQTADALVDLDAVDEVLTRFPALENVFSSPLVSHQEKTGLAERLFGPRVSQLVLTFLKVVSRHGRLDCLRTIRQQAHRLAEQQAGQIHVTLTTAAPLEPELTDRVAASLRAALGGEPIVETVTDPELIGGAVLRVGDTVYDGSVANQLEIARQEMIQRSVHEIQSRRDRFRNPAGN
jgi:F-type H+-transporting ATPase subunit delta